MRRDGCASIRARRGRCRDQRLNAGRCCSTAREECARVGAKVRVSDLFDLGRPFLLPRCIERRRPHSAHETFARGGTLGDGGLPEAPSHLIPAADFDALSAVVRYFVTRFFERRCVSEEQSKNTFRVGLHVAAESAKAPVNGSAR